jgi:hypothetical protein
VIQIIKTSSIVFTNLVFRRLILGAVLLISKFYNDVYYSNNYIASINGLPVRLVNEIERIFAKIIDYNLFVSEE